MSSKPLTDLDSNLKLLRTSLNAIYGYTGNMLEAKISQGQRNSRQAVPFEPSREDLEQLESFRRQFNEVCDELYLNLQLAKETFERELQSKGPASESKRKDDSFTTEETKKYNDRIALLERIFELERSTPPENM
ncbi:18621_t:CDS:2 [Acaulospora morrowiae]|uniref:18621_t:CDS:1 n=1 Tax=Acaulospora morrowiae TaxID=94023 RepID=A0A9N9DS93_9GLOM|nr:18621_t:CDS:2 [Acaulospora morrowiae]